MLRIVVARDPQVRFTQEQAGIPKETGFSVCARASVPSPRKQYNYSTARPCLRFYFSSFG